MSFEEQIMFKEIYLSIFQSQLEAIDHEYIILQMFFTTRAGLKIGGISLRYFAMF